MFRRLFYILSYLHKPPWDTGISPPELLDFVHEHPPGHALDIGCGTGTNAITLAEHGWQVIGIDFVPAAIRAARIKARKAGVVVDFRVGNVTRLDNLPGSYDLVLDIGCFHSLSNAGKQAYASNLPGLLADEGTFLIYGFLKLDDQDGTGIDNQNLAAFEQHLELISRREGTDRGERSSVWLAFTPRCLNTLED